LAAREQRGQRRCAADVAVRGEGASSHRSSLPRWRRGEKGDRRRVDRRGAPPYGPSCAVSSSPAPWPRAPCSAARQPLPRRWRLEQLVFRQNRRAKTRVRPRVRRASSTGWSPRWGPWSSTREMTSRSWMCAERSRRSRSAVSIGSRDDTVSTRSTRRASSFRSRVRLNSELLGWSLQAAKCLSSAVMATSSSSSTSLDPAIPTSPSTILRDVPGAASTSVRMGGCYPARGGVTKVRASSANRLRRTSGSSSFCRRLRYFSLLRDA
jgi:hypothetical protein